MTTNRTEIPHPVLHVQYTIDDSLPSHEPCLLQTSFSVRIIERQETKKKSKKSKRRQRIPTRDIAIRIKDDFTSLDNAMCNKVRGSSRWLPSGRCMKSGGNAIWWIDGGYMQLATTTTSTTATTSCRSLRVYGSFASRPLLSFLAPNSSRCSKAEDLTGGKSIFFWSVNTP